ncbi:MAG TPA: ThiF family adenylyltransferase [Candidatus Bilamarchaeaceae archaeon]|nr:ThiF family adenylyltransferase [Candidatus Bilamarchaeaceae archaeon]
MYNEKFFRNTGILSNREQFLLKKSKIAIVGLGGTGGIAFETLIRIGIQDFIIFDKDRFELTNFNRQIFADDSTLDQRKIDVAEKKAKRINKVKIKKYLEFNAKPVAECDIIIDCTDNVPTRLKVAKAARLYNIPYVFCSSSFAKGMVSIFTDKKFEEVFQLPKKGLEKYNTCSSVISFAPIIAGTLAASQAVNFLLKKSFIKAPDFLFFDLFKKEPFWIKKI